MRVCRFYVYILASRSKTLYVGVTNNIWRRVLQHREGTGSVFTKRYRILRLMHDEEFWFIHDAIERERTEGLESFPKADTDRAAEPILERSCGRLVAVQIPPLRCGMTVGWA